MHGHVGTFSELIGLAPRNVDDDAFVMPRDVIDIELHELRAAKRCGKAHEQERSITHTKHGRRKRFDYRAKIRRRERRFARGRVPRRARIPAITSRTAGSFEGSKATRAAR